MEVTMTIPDEIVPDLQNGGVIPLSRRALEFTITIIRTSCTGWLQVRRADGISSERDAWL